MESWTEGYTGPMANRHDRDDGASAPASAPHVSASRESYGTGRGGPAGGTGRQGPDHPDPY
ncbi:MAG: hypothetical protein EOO71_05260, partial [Myxococcaceae bacterium]